MLDPSNWQRNMPFNRAAFADAASSFIPRGTRCNARELLDEHRS
jgi:hypothetical protein